MVDRHFARTYPSGRTILAWRGSLTPGSRDMHRAGRIVARRRRLAPDRV
jgi:hypothetical protein